MEDYKKELEDYFCRFTFGQFVTLVLLEIVTLFFVFYLGARYGGDLLGNRDNTAKKEESVLPKNNKSVDDLVGGSAPAVNYTYPDVLTGNSNKAIKVKPSGLSASDYEKESAKVPVEVPVAEPTPAPVVEKAEPIADVEPVAEKPIETLSKTSHGGKFSIQVGSYSSSTEAKTRVSHWKKRGYSAFMTTGEIPGKGTWYRVRLGAFSSKPEAQKFLDKIKTKEKTDGIVVPSKS